MLTRDRQFQYFRDADDYVFLIDTQSVDDQARCLSENFQINWLYRPFSRCMMCNEYLIEGTEEQRAGLTVKIRKEESLRYCPQCQRLYWNGGHVHRMENKLMEWQKKWGKH